jgi:periplasmic protein TonB
VQPAITEWKCAFPKEADAPPEVDHAAVIVKVDVGASGHATNVEVFDDPGRGFGDAAKACALGATYEPARDEGGKAVAGQTSKVRIHFDR